MKKILLSLTAAMLSLVGTAQVIVYVQAPSPNEGNYDFTYAEGTTWGVGDLTDPVNAVSGIMEFVDDGTAADSLACNPLINDLNGKVAVLYRGSCEFGLKAFNAQEAGAVGVIIINNAAGAPVAMGGGANGLDVTIPVVMISAADGALLRPEILAENTTVFIGSKNGLYDDDLGMTDADVLRAKSFSNLQLLSQDDTEFSVDLGSWVRNYGNNDQTNITLSCSIDLNSSNIYSATSAPFDLVSGDSVFVPLAPFSQSSYANGFYEVTYTINMGATDESSYDNVRRADFMISDSLWSYSLLNSTTFKPVNDQNQFNGSTNEMQTCIAFQDANASRVAVMGMNFSAGTSQNPTPTSIDGEFLDIIVYEWTDVFTDINDVAIDFNNIGTDQLASVEYIYTSNAQSENIYVGFDEPIVLEDDVRYLFCLRLPSPTIYPGYESTQDYNWNFETYLQPINMLQLDGGQWFPIGFGTDLTPAISVNFIDATTANLVELPSSDLAVYPNPANEFINVPLGYAEGNVQLEIVDITGKIVSTQTVVMNSAMVNVDVTTLPTGVYTLKLTYADGTCKEAKVIVTR